MDIKDGQSWIYRALFCWIKIFTVLILGNYLIVKGASDICEQQAQSSFQLKKLSSSSSNEKCAKLCCKDTHCTVPLKVKRHCYGLTCAKTEICQIIYEQLKQFEGHRVDKREADEDDNDDWQNDNNAQLKAYQKGNTFNQTERKSINSFGEPIGQLSDSVFAAFLIQETDNDISRKYRGPLSNFMNDETNGAQELNGFPRNLTEENRIYINLNDSDDKHSDGNNERILKRSTDDDDDDDIDSGNGDASDSKGVCSDDSKFDNAEIPHRKKTYQYKRLAKKSNTLKSCSKTCCETDNCILSFLVEKSCIGVICKGDGNCHTKKEKLPGAKLQLSLMKREVSTSTEKNHENNEEKRSTHHSKEVDLEDESESDTESKRKHNSHKKKSFRKHKKHPAKKKDDVDEDDDEKSDEQPKKRKKHLKHKNEDDQEDDGQNNKIFKKKKKHKAEKKNNEDKDDDDDDDDHESDSQNKQSKKKKKDIDDDETNSESKRKRIGAGNDRHGNKERHVSEEREEEEDDSRTETEEEISGNEATDDVDVNKHEPQKNTAEMPKKISADSGDMKELIIDSKESHADQVSAEEHIEPKHRKNVNDEYSDDVGHLVRSQTPRNSTLFDDTVVGDEEVDRQDPDGQVVNDDDQRRENEQFIDEEETAVNRDGRGGEEFHINKNAREAIDRNSENDGELHHVEKNKVGEIAGRGDESLTMRKVPFAENEKRNDLMVTHRHYEDVEDLDDDGDTYDKEKEELYSKRHKRIKPKDFKETEESELDDYGDKDPSIAHHTKHSEESLDSDSYEDSDRHQLHHRHRELDASREETLHHDRLHHHFIKTHDPTDDRRYYERDKWKHYHHSAHDAESKFNSHRMKSVTDETNSSTKVKKTKKSNAHHASKNQKRHKTKTKASHKKKHSVSKMNKEEKIIEKLEHLEEKLEAREHNKIKGEKKKVSQKVEEGKDTLGKSKGRRTKHTKKGSKKIKELNSKMENSDDFSPSTKNNGEEIVIPVSSRKKQAKTNREKKQEHMKVENKVDSVKETGSGDTESSGSGSGDNHEEVQEQLMAYEQHHHVEESGWTQHDIVVPYNEKKSHMKHHKTQKMPILNEEMSDSLRAVKYEKKDKIAFPSLNDQEKYKKDMIKANAKHSEKSASSGSSKSKSHTKSKKATKKTHHKRGKQKGKSKEIAKSKHRNDMLTEFKKYQEFLKAQEIMNGNDGSGEDEASGHLQKVFELLQKDHKASDKHKSKKKDKKVSKRKNVKKSKKKKKILNDETETDSSGAEDDIQSSTEPVKSKHENKPHKHDGKNNDASDKIKNDTMAHENATSVHDHTAEMHVNASNAQRKSNADLGPEQKESSSYEDIKMFHDRKLSSSNEETNNVSSLEGRNISSNKNKTQFETSKTIPTLNMHHTQTTEQNIKEQFKSSTANNGTNVGVNAGHHKPMEENSNATYHLKGKPSSSSINRTQSNTLTKSSVHSVITTKKPIVSETPPLTHVVATTKSTTTIKVKKPKKTTKPTTKPTKKKKKKKRPSPALVTTSVPTLNIMTGDEDVNTGDVEPATIKQKLNKPKEKDNDDKFGKKRKPTNNRGGHHGTPKQKNLHQIQVSIQKENHPKKIQSTAAPRRRTTAIPTLESPFRPNIPTRKPTVAILTTRPPILNKVPAQGNGAGNSGSIGILGDLQLPEPPGNGNIAAGPPYYGQQGFPGKFPLEGAFNGGPNHIDQQAPLNQPAQSFKHNGQNAQSIYPPGVMSATLRTILSSPAVVTTNQQYPLQKPDALPYFHKLKTTAYPNHKQPHNNIPESPSNVIQRILGHPKPTARPSLKNKAQILANKNLSPLKVINRILGKPLSFPTVAQNQPMKNSNKWKIRPKVEKIHINQVKPAANQQHHTSPKQTPPKENKAKSPKVTEQKKQGPLNRLNDFFNKENKHNAVKTPVNPKAPAPHQTRPRVKVAETSAPVNPQIKKADNSCPVSQTLDNMVLANGRQAGKFTRMPGYPDLPTCIRECCKAPTCDLLFKSGEVCYLVQCRNQQSCKTEPLKEPTIHTRIVLFKKKSPIKSPANSQCAAENAFGISWKSTKPGEFATRTCPRDAKGNESVEGTAKRRCMEHAKWFTPDFSGCISDDYTNLNQKTKELGFTTSVKDIVTRLEGITTQTIDNSFIFGGDLVKANAILDTVSNYVKKNHAERFGFQALRKFARSVSNLLDETNKQEWKNADNILHGPAKIMKALENFGIVTAGKIPPINNMQPIVTNNMVMSVAHLSNIKKYVFPNYSMPILKKWTTKRDTIILPGSIFKSGVVKVASINYKSLAHFLPHQWNTANHVTFTDGFRVNSKILSSTIYPEMKPKINPPVTIILHHLKEINSARTKCVFWDFSMNVQNGGSWSSDGCWVVTSNATVTVCQCDHLTHFAVLMNLNDEDRVSAKEQAKENTFALMWLGIPILVVLLVGAMYTCFAWSKAPRRRHVVVKDGKPRLPEDDVIVTKTIKEDFPGSPNRFLYSSYNSPSPSDLEWEHAWDFLTNSEFENWQGGNVSKRRQSRRKRIEIHAPRILRERRKRMKDKMETSEYFSEGDSFSFRWKHQDDNEWSRDRIKCLGKGIVDVSSEASQPIDSLEEFSDATSSADGKEEDKCSNSFEMFSPEAISSPRSGYCTEPKYYSFVYKSDLNLKERENCRLAFEPAIQRCKSERQTLHSSCSSIETLRTFNPKGVQKIKYASTTSLSTIGQRCVSRFIDRKWNSKISLISSSHTNSHSESSGFLDKTWSSKYASSLSMSTLTRSLSARTIGEDVEGMYECFDTFLQEQGYGTLDSSETQSNDVMELNITSISSRTEIESYDFGSVNKNIPTYDMNLLTPSKKPDACKERIVRSDSMDISWFDTFNFNESIASKDDIVLMSEKANIIPDVDTCGFLDVQNTTKTMLDQPCTLENQNAELSRNTDHLDASQNIQKIEGMDIVALKEGSCVFNAEIITGKSFVEKQQLRDDKNEFTYSQDSTLDATKRIQSKKIQPKRKTKKIKMPKTFAAKRKIKQSSNKIDSPLKTNTGITRSPSKHMRSYIALRQQSRYSDHERQGGALMSEDEKTKKKKKKLNSASRKSVLDTQRSIESESSEFTIIEGQFSKHAETMLASVEIDNGPAFTSDYDADADGKEVMKETKFIFGTGSVSDVNFSENDGEQVRRCVETSVFGVTLKRWKGRSRLSSVQNAKKGQE